MLDEEASQAQRLMRVGTWLWVIPPSVGATNEELSEALGKALQADTRVLQVNVPPLNPHWTGRRRVYPDRKRTSPAAIRTGEDALQVLELSEHVTLQVRVPVKNQPTHGGFDDVPSDTYWVAWDGVSVFVLWEQFNADETISGGHVVADILRDAVESVGSDLYVQSCSPGCDFMFLHRTLRVVFDPEVDLFAIRQDAGTRLLDMAVGLDREPAKLMELLPILLKSTVSDFANFKNLGRRLIDLEEVCRQDLTHLLHHYQQHAQLVAQGVGRAALLERWRERGWRREASALVSDVWLALANMETLRRGWDRERQDVARETDVLPLFDLDFARDVTEVEATNMSAVAGSVTQVAAELNNRLVVVATGWGALAGGLAGGLVGLLN